MLLTILLIILEKIIQDTPNKVAIIVATNYINYVISLRVPGFDIHR